MNSCRELKKHKKTYISLDNFHKNLHSSTFELAAQIVKKVFYDNRFSCCNRIGYKGISVVSVKYIPYLLVCGCAFQFGGNFLNWLAMCAVFISIARFRL